jgi:zinc finger CCHC domain-containing protein 9
MYPNGGCCRYCQSVEHLARDCPSKQIKKDDGSIALGKLDLEQGGDDDDVFLAMYNKQQHHPVRKEPKAKRKVVHF